MSDAFLRGSKFRKSPSVDPAYLFPKGEEPLLSRFLAKVAWRGECLEWTGALRYGAGRGYGVLVTTSGGKKTKHIAHRLAHEWGIGPILPGLCVDHLCYNTRCVNPVHLEAVTVAENSRRACHYYQTQTGVGFRRGFRARGFKCGHPKEPENITEYGANKSHSDGPYAMCRICANERSRTRYYTQRGLQPPPRKRPMQRFRENPAMPPCPHGAGKWHKCKECTSAYRARRYRLKAGPRKGRRGRPRKYALPLEGPED